MESIPSHSWNMSLGIISDDEILLMSPMSDPLTLKSHPLQRRHRFSKILFFDKHEVKNETFTFKEKNFTSFIIDRAATVGLVRTNHLPELSLAGECQSQREHQEGS